MSNSTGPSSLGSISAPTNAGGTTFNPAAPTSTLLSAVGTLPLPPTFLAPSLSGTSATSSTTKSTTLLNLVRHLSSIAIAAPTELDCEECIAARCDDDEHFGVGGSSGAGGSSSATTGAQAAAGGSGGRWAPVTKARKGSNLRVRREPGICTLVLYQPPIQSRAASQRPNVTTRPIISTVLYSDGPSARPMSVGTSNQHEADGKKSSLEEAATKVLLEDPGGTSTNQGQDKTENMRNAGAAAGWETVVQSLGWKIHTRYRKRGLRFVVAMPSSSSSSSSSTAASNTAGMNAPPAAPMAAASAGSGAAAAGQRGRSVTTRGWYTEVLVFRLFEKVLEEVTSSEVGKVEGKAPDKGADDSSEGKEAKEAKEVAMDVDPTPASATAAADAKEGDADPSESKVDGAIHAQQSETQGEEQEAKANGTQPDRSQQTARLREREREIAPGTLFVQVMTTVACGAAGGSAGSGGAASGSAEEMVEKAKEYTSDVILGMKGFVVVSKEE